MLDVERQGPAQSRKIRAPEHTSVALIAAGAHTQVYRLILVLKGYMRVCYLGKIGAE